MLKLHLNVWLVGVALTALGPCNVSGQAFPNKPIRILTGEAGGVNDFIARTIAQTLSASLGQNVIVENRPSALVGGIVSKAQPDGYTLLSTGNTFLIGPLLRKTSYDPVRDFSPITLTNSSPLVLVVHPSLSIKSVQDLIALAKAKPGQLNYASSGTGSSGHLAAELFNSMAGVSMVRITYKGTGPAMPDLLAGRTLLTFATAGTTAPHVKSGKLMALAVTTAQPSALLPHLPTIASSGVPGYESASMQIMLAPANTPAALISRLNQEVVRGVNRADVKEKIFNNGSEVVGSSPEQLAAVMKAEIARLGKVIKDAGIREE